MLLVYMAQLSHQGGFVSRHANERIALVLLAIPLAGFLTQSFIFRSEFYLFMASLCAAFFCREWHFPGTSDGIYIALALLGFWAVKKKQMFKNIFNNRHCKIWLFATFATYLLSQLIARRVFRYVHLPQEDQLHIFLEETVETTAHLLMIATCFIFWKLKPEPVDASCSERWIKDRIVFRDSWEQYFQLSNLNTFDDFYDFSETSTVNKNKKRNVQEFSIGEGRDQKTFFMKRFHDSHFKDLFSAACDYGWPISISRVEFENAIYLLSNGIDTYKPACVGIRSRFGIETSSFLITEKLDSESMVEFITKSWNSLNRSEQDEIIVEIAEFVRRIHELDISFPDMYLWHIFIRPGDLDEKYQFSIIDLHRMTKNCRNSHKKIKNLSRLCWSMSSDYFDDEHKNLLLTAYLDNNKSIGKDSALRIIRKYSAILEKRRTLKNYYPCPETKEL